jgi:hypothetical protein
MDENESNTIDFKQVCPSVSGLRVTEFVCYANML